MRRGILSGLLVVMTHFSALSAHAGIELIVYAQPFHAHQLAGIVLDPSGAPVPGVLVQVCDQSNIPWRTSAAFCGEDEAHILASGTTDDNGHFSFPKVNLRHTRYLHLGLSGFDPMEVRVKWRLFAPRELRLRLEIAT